MRKFSRVLIALALLAIFPAPAAAQRGEVFGGYSYERQQIAGPIAFNASGWNTSAAAYFTKNIGLVADFSGNFATKRGADFHENNFLFGPQVAYHGDAKLRPFARLLFGATTATDTGIGSTDWAYGFGGGVDVAVTNTVAVRALQADYIRTHVGGGHQNNVRLSVGVTFRFGGVK